MELISRSTHTNRINFYNICSIISVANLVFFFFGNLNSEKAPITLKHHESVHFHCVRLHNFIIFVRPLLLKITEQSTRPQISMAFNCKPTSHSQATCCEMSMVRKKNMRYDAFVANNTSKKNSPSMTPQTRFTEYRY